MRKVNQMWTRVNGLYKVPTIKTLLALTATSTFLSSLQNSYPAVFRLLQIWASPTSGVWLASSVLLYTCRSVERRLGSHRFINFLFVAGIVSLAIAAVLRLLLVPSTPGLGQMLTFAIAVEHLLLVPPLNSWPYFGVSITSNVVIYGLIILIIALSPSHALSLAGIAGGIVGHKVPSLLPTRLTAALLLLGGGDFPNKVHSGATLEVQQQQQYDHIEELMLSLQTLNNRQADVRQRVIVPQQLIQQLVDIGFSQDDARRALITSGGNIDAAIHLLANRNY